MKEIVRHQLGQEKIKLLKLTGESMLSEKSNAATIIFVCFNYIIASICINLLTCLASIHYLNKFNNNKKCNALFQSLIKFKNIFKKFTLCI